MSSFFSTNASTLNDSISHENRTNWFRVPMENNRRNDLPPEPLSNYYEERKQIIFSKEDVNSNEDLYLNLVKQSQLIVRVKFLFCVDRGFFIKNEEIYNLSLALKENIANYSLIFSVYFIKGENVKAYKLFEQMCEQNESPIKYLSFRIIHIYPKMRYNNSIRIFYPTMMKTMLQILSIFIKLSGKFNKPTLEKKYITLYSKIIHSFCNAFTRFNTFQKREISSQLENERRYFYTSFLFDSSLYLFNRYQPLSTVIDILQHIFELYENNLALFPEEIGSILLLKVSFNLGLFYYANGNNNESINKLIQARKRLLDIKSFPKSTLDNANLSSINNSDFNSNINITNSYEYDDSSERKALDILKERISNNDSEYGNRNLSPKYISNIYLGAYSLLTFKSPILLDEVKEKILVEIELLLSEIELNRKNYKESLNHINIILNMNSLNKSNNNVKGIDKNEKNKNINNNKFKLNIKSSTPSDSNLLCFNNKKNNINNNNKAHPLDNIKLINYVLSNSDRNRMMFLLKNIESGNNGH